ncbi:MAG TPA: apolipoprotein N-acyltransferase [Woeseiaceae bacterium]|nr:apolipoprotein N-acyltransferase [Woeseiaceae bacterium]
MTTAFAPFGLSLLVPVLLLPLLYVCLSVSPRDAGWLSFFFGFGLFLSGTYWIYISVVVFGQAPPWIALVLMLGLVLIMSAWLFAAGWLISRFAGGEPWLLLLVAPATWVFIEWLRGWVLTGFPWLAIGYSQVDSLLAGWAPVIGVYGVSFMAMLGTTAILVAIMTEGRQRAIAIAILVLPPLGGGILKFVEWTEPKGSQVESTIVQAGISQAEKWLPERLQPTLEFYRDAAARAAGSELVVWPEVAVPALDDRVKPYIAALQADTRGSGRSIVFGILERDDSRGEARIYNSVMLVSGDRRQTYRKRHLVPFGEYFPVPARVREWMRMMSLPHNDLAAGADVQPLLQAGNGEQLAVAICYEDAYGAEQLYALPAASILINVSNDAWFGDSIAPHQHLQIARMRSLEVGRPAIRATNTGISAFISHTGKVLEYGAQFEPVILTMDVQPRSGSTPYARTGNLPVIGLCVLVIGVFWARGRARL